MMKKYLIFVVILIALISLSCSLKRAFSEEENLDTSRKSFTGSLSSNEDYFGQNPLPSEWDQKADSGEAEGEPHDELANENEADKARTDESKPFAVYPNGDFYYTDANGVSIIKTNGMQVTQISDTEIYYLPDQI